MEWIEEVRRAAGKLRPVFVNSSGARRLGALSEVEGFLPGFPKRKLKLQFNLHDLEQTSSTEYLNAVGFRPTVRAGHDVFRVSADGWTFLIPAYVLLIGLIGHTKTFADEMLRASSIHDLFLVDAPGSILVAPCSPLNRSKIKAGTFDRIFWLSCYLSTRQMWASVYLNATRGVLSCRVPRASAEATVSGVIKDRVVYVTRLFVGEVNPCEEPFKFAPSIGERTLVLHRSAKAKICEKARSNALLTPYKSQLNILDPAISAGSAGMRLSDEEWCLVKPLLTSLGKYDELTARLRLDTVLEKLITGRPWADFAQGHPASGYMHRLQAYGRWEGVRQAIVSHRSRALRE